MKVFRGGGVKRGGAATIPASLSGARGRGEDAPLAAPATVAGAGVEVDTSSS